MEISITQQAALFLYSCAVGALCSVIYDILRAFRLIWMPGRILSFVTDLTYFLICGVITFLFLLAANNGMIRGFVFLGEILGWIIYHFTIGNFIMRILWRVIRWIRMGFRWLYRHTLGLLVSFLKEKAEQRREKRKKRKEDCKKSKRSAKKPLKQQSNVLYNKRNHFLGGPPDDMKAERRGRKKREIKRGGGDCAGRSNKKKIKKSVA